MENKDIQQQLDDIRKQLDVITRYMEDSRRKQETMESLKNDLTIISKDVFEVAVQELEEVADHFDTRDFIYLLKRVLRNIRTFNGILDSMESAVDFMQDLSPLSKDIFNGILESLDEFEKKGYFVFLSELMKIFDRLVTTFSVEDLSRLQENMDLMVQILNKATRPDVLQSIHNVFTVFEQKDEILSNEISIIQLMKELNQPETKKSMVFVLKLLKSFTGSAELSS